MHADLERLLLACPTLPSLPAVALEVLRLCRAEEIDLWRIADALSTDPALSARVLRAANSASLAARGKVATLTRAVPLLGCNTVLAVALSFSLVRSRRRGEAGALDRAAFWRRAVFSALAGRALAETSPRRVPPEEAFLAALLQDLGILALAEVFGGRYAPVWAGAGGDHAALASLERAAWGADHAEVSAFLVTRWALPAQLVDALAASHGAAPPRDPLADCVAASGRIADLWVGAPGHDPLPAALAPERLEAVMASMALSVPEAAADFDIDLGGAARVEEVLAEARRLPRALGLGAPPPSVAPPIPKVESGAGFGSVLAAAHEAAVQRGEPIALLHADAPGIPAAALVPIVAGVLRSADVVGVGVADGQAVLVLLPATGLPGAASAAERVRKAAREAGVGLVAGASATGPAAPLATVARLRATAAAAHAAARASDAPVALRADPDAPPWGRA
jgi:HD-like signal output (HDOD) protein